MAKVLTPNTKERIKKAIYKKADEFGYASSDRVASGQFMDQLVEDPNIGGLLKEYMTKERVRTYIKDGILNAYTKELTKSKLSQITPSEIVAQIYNKDAAIIQKGKGKAETITVLRANDNSIFVLSGGTLLKWETALRKALEIIANEPNLVIDGVTPNICLVLAVNAQAITDADKKFIMSALQAVNIKAFFCYGMR